MMPYGLLKLIIILSSLSTLKSGMIQCDYLQQLHETTNQNEDQLRKKNKRTEHKYGFSLTNKYMHLVLSLVFVYFFFFFFVTKIKKKCALFGFSVQ